jgi:HEAT repeat protein
MLQRNLLFAADCLADDIQIKPDLAHEVLGKLVALLDHPAPQVHDAAQRAYKALAATRHRDQALQMLGQTYPVDRPAVMQDKPKALQLRLSQVLVDLNAQHLAQALLWPLCDAGGELSLYTQAQRLRFEGWPAAAADYLLELHSARFSDFAIEADEDLSNSTLGPVNAAAARRVLGAAGLRGLIDALIARDPTPPEQAALRWIATITDEEPDEAALLPFLEAAIPPDYRCYAATRLLQGPQCNTARAMLHKLAATQPKQAPRAVEALGQEATLLDIDWRLLQDMALLPGHEQAAQAIRLLLKAGQTAIALPAALQLLASTNDAYDWSDAAWSVIESLGEQQYLDLALAAARWLALRPDFTQRIKACELLLEHGAIATAIPLLYTLACETHGDDGQRASSRLLALRQAERALPLLAHAALQGSPALQYEAHLSAALAGCRLSPPAGHPPRHELTLAIREERMNAYRQVCSDLCQVGRETLNTLADAEPANAARALGLLTLDWLEAARIEAQHIDELASSDSPALILNAAWWSWRAGQIEAARRQLTTVWNLDGAALSEPLRVAAVEVLGCISLPNAVDLLLQALQDPAAAVRAKAAESIGDLAATVAAPALVIALNDEDSQVRANAARALGQLGVKEAVSQLLAALADSASEVRSRVAEALGDLGVRQTVPQLLAALADNDSGVRLNVAFALGQMGAVEAVPDLLVILADSTSEVRSSAALALGQMGAHEATPQLLAALADSASEVRMRAAQALGELGVVEATPQLLAALADSASEMRMFATQALGELGALEAIPQLRAALADSDRLVRMSAAIALGELGLVEEASPCWSHWWIAQVRCGYGRPPCVEAIGGGRSGACLADGTGG